MRVAHEEDVQRVADAVEHDQCLVMIGDDNGRPLMKLSVTADGRGLIEAHEDDLAPAIHQLSAILSQSIRSGENSSVHVLPRV